MKIKSQRIWPQFLTAMVVAIAGALTIQSTRAANGSALYFTVASPSGAGYSMSGNYWSATETGTPGAWVEDSQMTFGTNDADLNYPPGSVFSVDLDVGTHLNGFQVNTTNATITLTGSANTYFHSSVINTVNTNSTLIWDITHDGGFNFNKQDVTFAGGGTNDFETIMGGNETSGSLTESMVNGLGTVILAQTATGSFHQPTVGYTLNSGVLDFATRFAAANAFASFGANPFAINGGAVDNISGSAQTLVVGSGGYSIGGDFTFIGSADLDFGTTPVALTVSPMITVSSNTLTIDGNISDGSSGYGITKAGAGTLALNGVNAYSGPTVVNGGTLVFGAPGSFPANAASVSVNPAATLDVSGAAPVALGPSQTLSLTNAALTVGYASSTAAITTPTLAVGGSTNIINVANLPVGVTFPLQVPVISYTELTGTFNFGLGTMPGPGFTAYISNNVANSSVDLVVVSGPVVRALTWSGSVNGNWDTTTANWLYQMASTTYNPGDLVRFDDTAAGQTSISLTKMLSPGALTVSNDTHSYNLGNGNSGGGYISGPLSLEKDGSGLLILDDGGNDFSGGVNINAGTVQVGNNDSLGFLGSGPVADNGALVFDNSANDASLTNNISGTGRLTHEGGDTLQLAGANTFTGNVLVTNNSTLALGGAGALGGNPSVTIASGSTLELNGFGLATNTVTVSGNGVGGNGAIINSGAEQDHAMQFVTLAGDATFGGSGRWDIRSGSGGAALSTGGNAYNLTKTGANQVSLVSVAVDPALGNVDVKQGTLALQVDTSGLGNPADTLTVESGAALDFYDLTNELNKIITLVGGAGPGVYSISNESGANVILGPVNLSGDCSMLVNGTSLALNGNLTGGQLTKDGLGTLIINGNASNAGITADTGELMLNGTCNGPISCNSIIPATFAGSGTNFGTTELAGEFYPGDTNVPGTITLNGLTLDSGATVDFDLGPTNAVGGGVNDLIQVNGNLTINGNSVSIHPMGLLEDGVTYRFANYTGTLTMNGSLFVSGSEGYTFTVDTSTPGQINLVPSGGPPVWNGGSTIDSYWSDAANWGGVSIASGDVLYFAGNNRLVNTNDTSSGTSYEDLDFNVGAGPFVLNGASIGLGGNINNYSTHLQTVNLAMTIGSGSPTFNAGMAGLVLAGGITNSSAALHLQGTNGTLGGPLQGSLGVTLDYTSGASNSWSLVGNDTSYLTNLIVAGDSMSIGTGSDSPSVAITNDSHAYPLEVGGLTTNITSVLTINSGMLTAENSSEQPLEVGANGSTGIINVKGGTLNISGKYIQIGDTGGTGIINQSGGTVNANAAGDFILGNQTNATGILNVSGGTFNIPNNAYVGFRGAGTWNISSNGIIVAGTVNMTRDNSDSPNASGTINLNSGGTLVMGQEAMGNSGSGQTGAINLNGGVLLAATNSTSFISSPSSPSVLTATVQAGGAIINDGGYAITISQPLVHDSALGTTNDGGLTKQGSGALTLSAASTYTGPTIVSNGTLEVDGSLAAGAVTVENGGTLAGSGSIGGTLVGNAGSTVNPGNGIAPEVLTVSSAVTLNGNVVLDLNQAAGAVTNDEIVAPSIAASGTITVTNLGSDLITGAKFQLFSTAVSGAPTVILPTHNAANTIAYAWQTNITTDGSITLTSGASGVSTTPTNIVVSVSGDNLNFSWPTDHKGWTLETNAVGLADTNAWYAYPGSETTTNEVIPIDRNNTNVFFRLTYTP